jgi:hypothetical protein
MMKMVVELSDQAYINYILQSLIFVVNEAICFAWYGVDVLNGK